MPYVDNQDLLSDAQALTATARSTNVINLSQSRNIGAGEPMALVVSVDVAADHTTGNESYAVAIEVDDDVAFGSATALASVTIPNTTVKNDIYVIPVPTTPTNSDNQYISANYTLGGTTPTITVTTYLTPLSAAPRTYVPYADGLTIS